MNTEISSWDSLLQGLFWTWLYIYISYHTILYYIIYCQIISYHIIWYYMIVYYIILYYIITWYHIYAPLKFNIDRYPKKRNTWKQLPFPHHHFGSIHSLNFPKNQPSKVAFLVSGGLWFRSVEKSLRTELYKRVATQRLANNMSSSMTQWDAVCDSKWYPVGMPSSLSMVWKILSGETAFKRQLLLWYKIQRNIEYNKGWAMYIRTEQIQARKAAIITAI